MYINVYDPFLCFFYLRKECTIFQLYHKECKKTYLMKKAFRKGLLFKQLFHLNLVKNRHSKSLSR